MNGLSETALQEQHYACSGYYFCISGDVEERTFGIRRTASEMRKLHFLMPQALQGADIHLLLFPCTVSAAFGSAGLSARPVFPRESNVESDCFFCWFSILSAAEYQILLRIFQSAPGTVLLTATKGIVAKCVLPTVLIKSTSALRCGRKCTKYFLGSILYFHGRTKGDVLIFFILNLIKQREEVRSPCRRKYRPLCKDKTPILEYKLALCLWQRRMFATQGFIRCQGRINIYMCVCMDVYAHVDTSVCARTARTGQLAVPGVQHRLFPQALPFSFKLSILGSQQGIQWEYSSVQ